MNNGTALAVRNEQHITTPQAEYTGLRMVVSPEEALKRVQELQAFVARVMVRDTDYGVIPGTGDKPALLQPGAQKLAEIYGFAIDFEDAGSTEDFDKPLFVYKKKCILTSRRDGRFICASIGSCNSREDRYAYRWVSEKQIPGGMDKAMLKYRDTKYGRKYRIANDDICGLANTMEKMACKRAMVGAVISATRSSGVFTQDVEDLPAEAFGNVEESRSWSNEPGQTATPKVQDAEFEEPPKMSDRVVRLLELYAKAETAEHVAATLEEAKEKNAIEAFAKAERQALSKAREQAEKRIAGAQQ